MEWVTVAGAEENERRDTMYPVVRGWGDQYCRNTPWSRLHSAALFPPILVTSSRSNVATIADYTAALRAQGANGTIVSR